MKSNQISKYFKSLIHSLIPQSQTNIFYILFNSIEEGLNYLDFKINSFKRENNILTAQDITSLRNLASHNGFEPKLKVPAKGYVKIKINSNIFNRVGYPIFLPAYAVFKNLSNGLEYFYQSDTMLQITSNEVIIPLSEGVMRTKDFVSTAENTHSVERFYLDSKMIAENSISIIVNNVTYKRVKSFIDNDGINDNKQFMVKFSNNTQNPIVLYVRGLKMNDVVKCVYKESVGESGNLLFNSQFTCDEFLNNKSEEISFSDDEVIIYNVSGFNYGSDGSDVNSLRSAIGFNHGVNLLFDKTSYINFINKYSTLMLQEIDLSNEYKAIKFIYLSKRIYLFNNKNNVIIPQYKNVVNFQQYFLTDTELKDFNNILEENEYALSSHVLKNANTIKYAIQIMIDGDISSIQYDSIKLELTNIIYTEFSKFLYDKYHTINFEILFNDYMLKNKNIKIDYVIFDSENNIDTNKIIKHIDKLPLLKGDFNITDSNNITTKIFEDINWVLNK